MSPADEVKASSRLQQAPGLHEKCAREHDEVLEGIAIESGYVVD
jgi:hypothetical protein